MEQVRDPEALADFFGDAPGVHIYALADLEAPYWPASVWWRRGDAVVGWIGLPDGDGCTLYAVSTRAPDATLALVQELAPRLPPSMLLTGPVGLREALAGRRPLAWSGRHRRYVLSDPARLPPPDPRLCPLDPADQEALEELYAAAAGAVFFRPAMLTQGSFVGVRIDGRLVAAAGTHVSSLRRRVAAIGAVFTHPDHRGQGWGGIVTTGVCHRIAPRVDRIGLNVAEANHAAIRIYDRLGFTPVLDYEEAEIAP